MNYPVWDVPHLGSGWVIGLIAIFHVMISQFAVGGGLYLPVAEYRALRQGKSEWLEFLPAHSKFFLILTGVYGVVSGVGIWFAIGLAAPEATSTLIHNFVFGWAIEWVFFVVELSSAAVYYYTWNRIPQKLHLQVGWLYAASSFMTLVIINGILAFMLTPGNAWLEVAGTGQEASRFFQALLNPTYWPSLALRTLVCLSLAGIWALVTGSRIDVRTRPELKSDVLRWSTYWLLPSFFLMPVCLLWYLSAVPESQRGLLELGISTIGAGVFTQVTRTVLISVMASATLLAVVYLTAFRKPRDFGLGYACAVVFLGLAATGATEQAREMLRKPYVICDHMYSNAIRKTPTTVDGTTISEVDRFNAEGYLTHSIWVTDEERRAWSAGRVGEQGTGDRGQGTEKKAEGSGFKVQGSDAFLSQSPPLPVSPSDLSRGELMFRGQCMACHTKSGYRSMRRLLAGRNRESIGNILSMLHRHAEDSPYRAFMPPLVGTSAEIEALGDYLNGLVAPAEPETTLEEARAKPVGPASAPGK